MAAKKTLNLDQTIMKLAKQEIANQFSREDVIDNTVEEIMA